MTTPFKEFTIELIDDPTFRAGSANNAFTYDTVYYDDTEFQPTSKYGIKVSRGGHYIASAIICETGGATGIHDKSFILTGNNLLICCCDTVYSFKLPGLALNWKKQFDPATCFSIYPLHDDFLIHGELQIKRVDINGNVKWNFSAKDIFVTQDGSEAVRLFGERIEITDWNGDTYVLNNDGKLIE